jgi:hypothetical protein
MMLRLNTNVKGLKLGGAKAMDAKIKAEVPGCAIADTKDLALLALKRRAAHTSVYNLWHGY